MMNTLCDVQTTFQIFLFGIELHDDYFQKSKINQKNSNRPGARNNGSIFLVCFATRKPMFLFTGSTVF